MKKIAIVLSVGFILVGCNTQSPEKVASEIVSEVELSEIPEVIKYSDDITRVLQTISKSLNLVTKDLGNITDSPNSLSDEDIKNIALKIVILSLALEQVDKVDVPEDMVVVHAHVEEAASNYKFIAENLLKAISEKDVKLLDEIGEKVDNGKEEFLKATQLISLILDEL